MFNSGFSSAISHTINMSVYGVVALIGLYYTETDYKQSAANKFVFLMLAVTCIVATFSIKAVVADPTVLRIRTHDWEGRNVMYGSYSFVYMCVQLVPFLCVAIQKKVINNGWLWKAESIICLLLCVILILLSGFTLANIILLFSLVLLFVFINPSTKKTLLIIGMSFAVLFSYKYLLNYIFSFLLQVTSNSPMYTAKIRDLYGQLVLGVGVGATYSNRLDLYRQSLTSVFKYPLIGSVFVTGKSLSGGHSTLVDALAGGGILYAGLMYWLMLVHPIKNIKRILRNSRYRTVILILFFSVVLLTGVLDTLTYENAWVWYLFIPYISNKIEKIDTEEYSEILENPEEAIN